MDKMKELIYKTVDGQNPRKKEVSIQESFDDKGSHINKRWVVKYFIKSRHETQSRRELKEWLDFNNGVREHKRNCHVLKETNTQTGETKVLCKMIGEFCVIKGLTIFKVLYVNALKIVIESAKKEGVK